MQSFGLLNQFLPSSSILDKGLAIWHFLLLYIFPNIILPVAELQNFDCALGVIAWEHVFSVLESVPTPSCTLCSLH